MDFGKLRWCSWESLPACVLFLLPQIISMQLVLELEIWISQQLFIWSLNQDPSLLHPRKWNKRPKHAHPCQHTMNDPGGRRRSPYGVLCKTGSEPCKQSVLPSLGFLFPYRLESLARFIQINQEAFWWVLQSSLGSVSSRVWQMQLWATATRKVSLFSVVPLQLGPFTINAISALASLWLPWMSLPRKGTIEPNCFKKCYRFWLGQMSLWLQKNCRVCARQQAKYLEAYSMRSCHLRVRCSPCYRIQYGLVGTGSCRDLVEFWCQEMNHGTCSFQCMYTTQDLQILSTLGKSSDQPGRSHPRSWEISLPPKTLGGSPPRANTHVARGSDSSLGGWGEVSESSGYTCRAGWISLGT